MTVSLRLSELVLKTANFARLRDWYTALLGHGPFLERKPDANAEAKPSGGQERASDVHAAFFDVYRDAHPHRQMLAVFGVPSLPDEPGTGTGMHHFQFRTDSFAALADLYERLATLGVLPHRSSNHGPATSFYYRDPDANIVELSCANFATQAEELAYMESDFFRANPSGIEIDPAEYVRRYRDGEPAETLLALV